MEWASGVGNSRPKSLGKGVALRADRWNYARKDFYLGTKFPKETGWTSSKKVVKEVAEWVHSDCH